uniref:Uncharacterized protein n=1 Tax=Timema cristinae TaxID=61476 RepID=A0A7R9H8Z8_TIMCR|nr:unnamed protein product [Timema cristinae]
MLPEDTPQEQLLKEVIAEAKFEKKFGVDVKRDIYTGDVIGVTKKPKDELSKMMMEGNIGKRKRELKPKNILSQVNKHERSKLKQSKKNNVEEDRFSSYQDEVKFGEVVHGPPDLTAPRKANKETNSSRDEFLTSSCNAGRYIGGANSSRRVSVNGWWVFPRYPMRSGSSTDTGLVGRSTEGTPLVGEERHVTKSLFPTVDAQNFPGKKALLLKSLLKPNEDTIRSKRKNHETDIERSILESRRMSVVDAYRQMKAQRHQQ